MVPNFTCNVNLGTAEEVDFDDGDNDGAAIVYLILDLMDTNAPSSKISSGMNSSCGDGESSDDIWFGCLAVCSSVCQICLYRVTDCFDV